MSVKNIMKKCMRAGYFMAKYIFWERPRGLDFSLRQKKYRIKAEGNYGYALTQKTSFDKMMKCIEIDSGDCFIDIGCGKGGCLLYAMKYPFKRIAGVEIEDSLYKIAVKNFKKLKISKVELYHDNAVTFPNYGDFNVLYLWNPFEPEIYRAVLDNIFKCVKEHKFKQNKIYLICYGISESDYITQSGLFFLQNKYVDKNRGTYVYIWKKKEELK